MRLHHGWAFCSKFKPNYFSTIPALNLNTNIIHVNKAITAKKREPSPTFSEVERQITPHVCTKLVPDQIMRISSRLRMKEQAENRKYQSSQVELVDGGIVKLRPKKLLSRSPHLEERIESQGRIRRMRQEGRIFNEVLKLTAQAKDPFLRLPIWRMTKITQSKDYQYLTIKWIIDDPSDTEKYLKPLTAALESFSSVIRHRLASYFSLRIAPDVKFQCDNHSVSIIAKELAKIEIKSDQP